MSSFDVYIVERAERAAIDETVRDLDLILIPGVAFDERCNRASPSLADVM